jgi:beta-lactamase regulating signal transducer with metallopeptidase domain
MQNDDDDEDRSSIADRRHNIRRHEFRRKEDILEAISQVTKVLKMEPSLVNHLESSIPAPATTFTITQVLAGLFAVVTIVGSLVATWTTLNTQITTLKVSSDLIFQQISKDQLAANNTIIEFRNRIDENLKDISDKIDNLNKKSK